MKKGWTVHFKDINFKNFTGTSSDATLLSLQFSYGMNADKHIISNLGRVNIFCGANNSGKSRFMRSLFLHYSKAFRWACPFNKYINELEIKKNNFNQDACFQNQKQSRFDSFYGIINTFYTKSNIEKIKSDFHSTSDIEQIITTYQNMCDKDQDQQKINQFIFSFFGEGLPEVNKNYCVNVCLSHLNDVRNVIDKMINDTGIKNIPKNAVYVPILRSLKNFSSESMFAEEIQRDYFVGNSIIDPANREIFTGQALHSQLTKYLTESSSGRDSIARFEKFLSKTFFDNQEVFLSPVPSLNNNKVIRVKIGTNERSLHELGDGVGAIILLTFSAFFSNEPKAFFIEEPELWLHPGLQRVFMDLITSNEREEKFPHQHIWFFTTHSNHILDSSLDHSSISIYNFVSRKDSSMKDIHLVSPTEDDGDASTLLSSLGVQATSVFRAERLIWVEGISDAKILRKYFKKYDLTQREGIDYAFITYGGNALVNFDFKNNDNSSRIDVNNISSKNFVVFDGDVEAKESFREVRGKIGEQNIYIWKGKEIENSLPITIIKDWAREKIKKSKIINKSEIGPKIDSINDGQQIENKKGLGEILDSKLEISYFQDGNTIKYKQSLADFTLKFESDFKLTDESHDCIEKIKKFLST